MARNSRDIGKVGERLVASVFRRVYPEAARNKDQFEGAHNSDVKNTPFWVEVKYWDRYPDFFAALKQALYDRKRAKDNRQVVVVSKKKKAPRTPWVATMLLEEYIELLEELERLRQYEVPFD